MSKKTKKMYEYTPTKINAFFRKPVYFEWEIYKWNCSLSIEKIEKF